MPTVAGPTRELAITYNSYSVGGSTGRHVHGFTRSSRGKDRASIDFDVVIVATSEAAFVSACQALESAYATPYADLTVTLGSTNLIAVTQSGNTGLDAIASVEKPGGPPDSGRSRRYRVRIEYGLPATWAATSGLRDSRVILGKTPSGRAIVTLKGTFTAVSSNDAKAVHDAAIDTWAAAQKTWLGISSWQLVEASALDVSVNRKTCEFSRLYMELVATQGAASVVRQSLTVTRIRKGSEYSPQASAAASGGQTSDAPGGTGAEVIPLTEISATYEAWIDKSVTTDLKATWATLESFVIAQIAVELGTSSFGMISAAPSYHIDDNRITAVVTGVAQDVDASSVVQNVFEQSIRKQPGWDFLPVWDGNPTSAIVCPGQEMLVRTTTRRWRTLGTSGNTSSGGGAQAGAPGVGGGGWSGFGFIDLGQALGVYTGGDTESTINAPPDAGTGNGGGSGASEGDGSGQSAGSGTGWYPIDSDTGTRPLAIGRKPFVIYLTERFSTLVERYVTAVD